MELAVAAKRLKTDVDTLTAMEDNGGRITMEDLTKLSKLYGIPEVAFFSPVRPQVRNSPDYRLLPDNQGKEWSPALRREYRRVSGQRDIAIELDTLEDEPTPNIELRIARSQSSEVCATRIRAWLDMPNEWPTPRDDNDILMKISRRIEDKGILVTQVTGVQVKEMRGFSIARFPFPAIALNGKDSFRGRVFTLMHELAHILLHKEAICDLEEPYGKTNSEAKLVEVFCNAVAAAALMPRDHLLTFKKVQEADANKQWTEREIGRLARPFGVSNEAMLRRLVTLGKATMDYYRERRAVYLQYEEEVGGGFLIYQDKITRNYGRRYLETVIRAYDRADINGADASRYLSNIDLKHFPELRDKLGVVG